MEDEIPEEPQRWTARRRAALVTSILKGETSAQEAARKHGLTVAEVEDWREKFLAGAENALRSRPRDDEEQQQEQLRRLKQKVADLVIEVDVLREATKNRPFVLKKSEE
jgi:transposase-like protein